jgi:hypothetical protein
VYFIIRQRDQSGLSDIHFLVAIGFLSLLQRTLTPGIHCIEQRTFIKDPATKKNIPIQAIGLSLYESLPDTTEEMIGSQIVRTQWLGPSKVLLGRRALIVDEVDDSRQTLQYVL